MKRVSKLFAATLATLLIVTGVGLASNPIINGVTQVNYQFVINDKVTQVPSQLMVMSRNNTTYVPLRFLSEQMGIEVEYKAGTILLNSEVNDASMNETASKKIEELQKEVDRLKAENNLLKEEIKVSDNISAYRELPTYAEDARGFRVTMYEITKSSDNKAKLSLGISNLDNINIYYLDPFKTEVTIDGKVYKPTLESGANLYTNLNPNSNLSGNLEISGLSDIKDIRGAAKFYYKVNNVEEKTLTVFFDTSK